MRSPWLLDLYPGARIVVPGHGAPGGTDLLTHSIDLLRARATPTAPPK